MKKLFQRYINTIGVIIILAVILNLSCPVDLIEGITMRDAGGLAEANTHSLKPLSLRELRARIEKHFHDKTQEMKSSPKLPLERHTSIEEFQTAIDYYNWGESCSIIASEDMELREGKLFFDGGAVIDCFKLTEWNNDLEEIEISLLPKDENKKEFFELIENQKKKSYFSPSPWPTYGWVSSHFGYRTSPFTGRIAFHKGIDFASYYGAPIYATNKGVVIFSDRKGEYGKTIIIQHSCGFSTLYGHNSVNVVKSGDRIKRGQLIGYVGNSGRSTAPHLHYEVREGGKCINPRKYLLANIF